MMRSLHDNKFPAMKLVVRRKGLLTWQDDDEITFENYLIQKIQILCMLDAKENE